MDVNGSGAGGPSEWDTERLDVDTYLDRLGHRERPEPTLETLFALHRAHVLAIPFENLDVLLDRGIRLDVDGLQHKLLHQRRGGYCFEHNLLFAALLERLGFDVTRLVARVRMGTTKVRPRTHMALRIDLNDDTQPIYEEGDWVWLADVGFGGDGLLEPIPLRDGAVRVANGGRYGLLRETAERWVVRSRQPDGWFDLYTFTLEPQHSVDYEVANHYTATHPSSPFANKTIVQRVRPHQRVTLTGRELVEKAADGTTSRRVISTDELAPLLKELGVELADDDLRRLQAREE